MHWIISFLNLTYIIFLALYIEYRQICSQSHTNVISITKSFSIKNIYKSKKVFATILNFTYHRIYKNKVRCISNLEIHCRSVITISRYKVWATAACLIDTSHKCSSITRKENIQDCKFTTSFCGILVQNSLMQICCFGAV